MYEDIDITTERLLASNQQLLDGYAALDPNSEDYVRKVEALTKMHHEVVEDLKNLSNDSIETRKLDADDARLKKESVWHAVGNAVQLLGIVLTGALGVAELKSMNKRFEQATRKEADEAILTTTDRTVVTDGLRSRPSGGFKLPFLGK